MKTNKKKVEPVAQPEVLIENLEAIGASHIIFSVGGCFDGAKRHLRTQRPVSRDVKRLGHLFVNQWIVVLQASPKAVVRERHPGVELRGTLPLLRPSGKIISIQREVVLKLMHDAVSVKYKMVP